MVEVGRIGRWGSQAEVMAGSDGGNFHLWAAHYCFVVFRVAAIIPNTTLNLVRSHCNYLSFSPGQSHHRSSRGSQW